MRNSYETGDEYCPKCGESWYGDCPNKPYWIEYRCENPECRYAKGEDLYTGEGMVIRDSDKEALVEALEMLLNETNAGLWDCLPVEKAKQALTKAKGGQV